MSDFGDRLLRDVEAICQPLQVAVIGERPDAAPYRVTVEIDKSNSYPDAYTVAIHAGSYSEENDRLFVQVEDKLRAIFSKPPYKIVFEGGTLTRVFDVGLLKGQS